jgi:hypothetical protein
MPHLDHDARRRLRVTGELVEPGQSPIDVLLLAASLLEQHAPTSSEARACADRLRKMVRALAAARRAERLFGDGR